jgi:carbonic anhydrase
MPEPSARTPERALELLMEGNRRWVAGTLTHGDRSLERRQELAQGQSPFATVFSCIDSRVTPEIVFDCGLGDLAVVRSGAHVLDEGAVLGSLQFGVAQLCTPLVLVLGHQACGAVTAAIDAIDTGQEPPVGLRSIVQAIRPAYQAASGQPGDLIQRTIEAHTRLTVQALTEAPLVDQLAHAGGVRVTGAYYSLDTGAVSILD